MFPDQYPPNFDPQVDDLNGRFASPAALSAKKIRTNAERRLISRFTFPSNHFDLVHSQMMAGGIHSNRWRQYVDDIFRVTRPGGWCQMVEIYFNAQSDNGTLTHGRLTLTVLDIRRERRSADERTLADHALRKWSRRYLRSVQPYKDPRAPLQMEAMLRSAGFQDVETRVLNLPMCAWPTSIIPQNASSEILVGVGG